MSPFAHATESQKLALYQRWVPDIQDALPLAPADRPSVRGHVTPMEVMDAPYRSGDLRHGYQAVADNLARLDAVDADPVDVGWSLATTRAALVERAVSLGDGALVARGRVGGEAGA